MRELLLEVCVEVKRVSSLYRGSYDGCGRGIVRSALQPSLGCNPGRPCQNLDPTAPGLVRPNLVVRLNLGLAQSSPISAGGLLYCSPPQTNSKFLAYSHTSLVLDIVRLIYRLS